MIRVLVRFRHAAPAIALGCLLAAPVWAAPGDPLGGDDTGCAPSTKGGLGCAAKTLSLIAKLRIAVLKCHLIQARSAFEAGAGTPEASAAEEACEAAARVRFDDKIALLASRGCDATVLANAQARRDVILGDQTVAGSMDALNAAVFCDATSGNPIDPGGDDGGYVPSTSSHYKCSVAVGKTWSRLEWDLYRCHSKLATAVFRDKVFDESACEETGPRSALGRYDGRVAKYVGAGICPSCLADPPGAAGIGTDTVAGADANLEETHICPGP